MNTPPLFTGKCWIGNNYRKPLPNLVESKDAQLIQMALLNQQDNSFIAFIKRIICN